MTTSPPTVPAGGAFETVGACCAPQPAIRGTRRRVGVTVGALVAMLLTACGSSTSASPEVPDDVGPPTDDPVVSVRDNVFVEDEIVVSSGTTVEWHFEGRIAHDVRADDFASEVLVEGEFTHTFTEVGTYPYTCRLHPGMDGVVYVVD